MTEQGFCAKCDRPSSMDNHAHNCLGEVCTHGSLKRQCQICELEAERDRWKDLAGRMAEALEHIRHNFNHTTMTEADKVLVAFRAAKGEEERR